MKENQSRKVEYLIVSRTKQGILSFLPHDLIVKYRQEYCSNGNKRHVGKGRWEIIQETILWINPGLFCIHPPSTHKFICLFPSFPCILLAKHCLTTDGQFMPVWGLCVCVCDGKRVRCMFFLPFYLQGTFVTFHEKWRDDDNLWGPKQLVTIHSFPLDHKTNREGAIVLLLDHFCRQVIPLLILDTLPNLYICLTAEGHKAHEDIFEDHSSNWKVKRKQEINWHV